jgi:hypothetical protein
VAAACSNFACIDWQSGTTTQVALCADRSTRRLQVCSSQRVCSVHAVAVDSLACCQWQHCLYLVVAVGHSLCQLRVCRDTVCTLHLFAAACTFSCCESEQATWALRGVCSRCISDVSTRDHPSCVAGVASEARGQVTPCCSMQIRSARLHITAHTSVGSVPENICKCGILPYLGLNQRCDLCLVTSPVRTPRSAPCSLARDDTLAYPATMPCKGSVSVPQRVPRNTAAHIASSRGPDNTAPSNTAEEPSAMKVRHNR